MKRIKNKTLIILLFFCSFQYGYLFSMDENNQNSTQQRANDQQNLKNDPDYQAILKVLSNDKMFMNDKNLNYEKFKIDHFFNKSIEKRKTYRIISSILNEYKPARVDILITYMEDKYKKDPEPGNYNPGTTHIKSNEPDQKNVDIAHLHTTRKEELQKIFTFSNENFEKEERLIYDLIKDGKKSKKAKKDFKVLSLILHPDTLITTKLDTNAKKNAETLFKYMQESYKEKNKQHVAQDIFTKIELDTVKILLKKDAIKQKNDATEAIIAFYKAPTLYRIIPSLPAIKYELESNFVQRAIVTACNKISNKFFATHFLDVNGISEIKNCLSRYCIIQ